MGEGLQDDMGAKLVADEGSRLVRDELDEGGREVVEELGGTVGRVLFGGGGTDLVTRREQLQRGRVKVRLGSTGEDVEHALAAVLVLDQRAQVLLDLLQ